LGYPAACCGEVHFRKITSGASVAIFILGFTWVIERMFDLKILAF
jgi:hypothetical protein